MKIRICIPILLCIAVFLDGCTHIRENRQLQPARGGDAGFVLPDKIPVGSVFDAPVVSTQNSSVMKLRSVKMVDSWERLNRTFSRLGVPVISKDETRYQIKTDWVSLKFDPVTNNVTTLPGLLSRLNPASKSLERHRFSVNVSQVDDHIMLRVSDLQRQIETDLAPDSVASFLEWQDHPAQAGAAQGFLAHLQPYYESTVQSRLIDASVIDKTGNPPVAKAQSISQSGATTEKAKPAPNKALDKQAEQARSKGAVATISSKLASYQRVSSNKTKQNTKIKKSDKQITTLVASPSHQALLMENNVNAVWAAVKKLLSIRDVGLKYADDSNHILETQWVEARYDEKTKTLQYAEQTQPIWAFSLQGNGIQQHRFKIQVNAAGEGAAVQSLIKVFHVEYQHLVDLTPDGSSTTLGWRQLPSDTAIADAYLRQFPIVVTQ